MKEKEIERKFILKSQPPPDYGLGAPDSIAQGYVAPGIRVRIIAGGKNYLTVKGQLNGMTRPEVECQIGDLVALALLAASPNVLRKIRQAFQYPTRLQDGTIKQHLWHHDEFCGSLAGLAMAEIELDSEDEPFDLPPWLGEEVTDDPYYYNENLAAMPQWNPPRRLLQLQDADRFCRHFILHRDRLTDSEKLLLDRWDQHNKRS